MKKIFDRFVLFVVAIALFLVGVAAVDFVLHPLATDLIFNSTLYRAVVMLVLVPLTLLVGFLIMRRVPGNVVGPLILVWSGTVAFWSVRAEIQPVLLALFDGYNTVFGWLAFFLMIAHFPNGEIYPARMAPWIYRLLGIFLLLPLGTFLSIGTLDVPSQMANPFYLPALDKVAGPITGLGIMGFSSIMVLALVPPVLRFRNGSTRERQQIKWLALFGAAIILYTIPAIIIYPLLTGGEAMDPGNDLVAMFFYLLSGLFPPLVIGIAIFRHHLWDIDILIRRTLVYSILTVILTLVYFGSVVILQALFTTVIGHQSPAAIVLSTLAIAATFSPLRRRIQSFIDLRFYRQKYNAERVLADFGTITREKVELDHLTQSILGVVEETLHPQQVSLWLLDRDREKAGGK